jgi:hypothetical protein
VQRKVRRLGDHAGRHDCIKVSALRDFVHAAIPSSNREAFTAFGATRVDNGTSTTCFHANQKTMGTRAACC